MKILHCEEKFNTIDAYIRFKTRRDKKIHWFRVRCPECDEELIGINVWEMTKVSSYKNGFYKCPHYSKEVIIID